MTTYVNIKTSFSWNLFIKMDKKDVSCERIVSPVYERKAAIRKLQEYGCLNKTCIMTTSFHIITWIVWISCGSPMGWRTGGNSCQLTDRSRLFHSWATRRITETQVVIPNTYTCEQLLIDSSSCMCMCVCVCLCICACYLKKRSLM